MMLHTSKLQPVSLPSTVYQLPAPYGIQDIARMRFYRSRSLREG